MGTPSSDKPVLAAVERRRRPRSRIAASAADEPHEPGAKASPPRVLLIDGNRRRPARRSRANSRNCAASRSSLYCAATLIGGPCGTQSRRHWRDPARPESHRQRRAHHLSPAPAEGGRHPRDRARRPGGRGPRRRRGRARRARFSRQAADREHSPREGAALRDRTHAHPARPESVRGPLSRALRKRRRWSLPVDGRRQVHVRRIPRWCVCSAMRARTSCLG